jgi:uncharacterized protein (TIGR03118 family)
MRRTGRRVDGHALLLALALVAIVLPSAGQADIDGARARRNAFVRRDLVVNRPELATPDTQLIDPLLVNPWGAAIRTAGLGGHFWLANAAGPTVPAEPKCFTVTEYVGDVYDGQGGFVPIFQDALKLVTVEGPPIGQVFSGSASDFPVTGDLYGDDGVLVCAPDTVPPPDVGTFTGPARFIVATEDGKWAAWTEGRVNGVFGRMRQFVTVVDRSAEGALYRGLAITDFPSGNWLCAANFSQDRIDCLDSQWQPIPQQVFDGPDLITPFAKPAGIPNGPRKRYVPFNIQYLAGHFYVTYAELVQPGDRDFDPADPITERACEGCGYVAVFNRNGRHLRTLESRDRLNAPWGLAIAPHGFGAFSNALLVGNFGDGTIVGIDLRTGQQLAYLQDTRGRRIAIDGLWALFFGNGASLGRSDVLYWTAGPNDETDGAFGSLSLGSGP